MTLKGIAQNLINTNKKVQLIYAFNGTGKTRLSRDFKELVDAADEGNDPMRVLYYNALIEDLFYWDNGLDYNNEPKLSIRQNEITELILKVQGQSLNVINTFQRFTNDKLTPSFNQDYKEVSFSYRRGNDEVESNIKISKGEESCFIWSIFATLLEQVISILNIAETEDRETPKFNYLKYIFIDDPVSSLDENHLIQLAVDLAQLVKSSKSDLKFIITTHNALFFNVLYNELNCKSYMLSALEDGSYKLEEKKGDSNQSFSYHLHIKKLIQEAVNENKVQRYHFALLRNLYEKTSNFLGYKQWSDLLPNEKAAYASRIMNFYPHNTLSNEEIVELPNPEKAMVKFLLEYLENNYAFHKEVVNNA